MLVIGIHKGKNIKLRNWIAVMNAIGYWMKKMV